MEFESWELAEFNLQESVKLNNKFGLIKIYRSEDGVLVLVGDSTYGLIDQENPSYASFLKPDSLLGFVLDIGVQKKKRLTYGHGFYFGTPVVQAQSGRAISQGDFDTTLFEKIGNIIETYCHSGDKNKEIEAIKVQLLLDAYNNSRLLYPNFYAESYLGLLQIIDAIGRAQGGHDFATFAASVSPNFNREVHNKIVAISAFHNRVTVATQLFDFSLKKAQGRGWSCSGKMAEFDDAAKFVFSCFFSAYQYRNSFVHNGFPFPDTIKDSWGKEDSGAQYLSGALGISWSKIHRPDGLEDGDLIDIHEMVEKSEVFKETYFQLLPTWHFLKRLTRFALLNKIEGLK